MVPNSRSVQKLARHRGIQQTLIWKAPQANSDWCTFSLYDSYRLTLDEKDAFDKMGFISTVEFAPNYRDVYQGIGARNCSPEYDPSRDLMGVIFSQRVCK